MTDYCECGIKLQGGYCPRCQKQVVTEEQIRGVSFPKYCTDLLDSLDTRERQQMESLPKVLATVALDYKCDQCGTPMPNACRAKCSNCGWEKPC